MRLCSITAKEDEIHIEHSWQTQWQSTFYISSFHIISSNVRLSFTGSWLLLFDFMYVQLYNPSLSTFNFLYVYRLLAGVSIWFRVPGQHQGERCHSLPARGFYSFCGNGVSPTQPHMKLTRFISFSLRNKRRIRPSHVNYICPRCLRMWGKRKSA